MRVKISINKMMVCMILLAILGEFNFFGIWHADGIYKKIIMLAAILAAAGLCLMNSQANRIVFCKYMSVVRYVAAILIFAFFVQLFHFVLNGADVTVYEYMADAGRFTYVIALIPLVYVLEDRKLSKMFWKGFKLIAFAQIIIGEIQDFILRVFGINLLNSRTSWRGGRLGILIVVPLVYIPMIVALSELLNRKTKMRLFNFLLIVLGIHFGVFISKNRSGFLAFFAAAAVMIFTSRAGSRNKLLRNCAIAAFGIAAIGYVFLAGYVQELFSISGGEFSSSNNGHIKAVRDCWNYFKHHPLLGAGFRLRWPVSYCDAGFVGLLANVGIFGIYIFLIPELKAVFRVIGSILKRKHFGEAEIFKGFTVFAFFTAVTFILTDESRMMGWVVIYAYMSYVFANHPMRFYSFRSFGYRNYENELKAGYYG